MRYTDDGLLSALDLSRLTGCSIATVMSLHRKGMIPLAASADKQGGPLWDADNPRLAAWVDALQGAGYHVSFNRK